MKAVVDFLLVGRTPLGSSIRGVLVATLVMLFWALILEQFWTLVVVSLITALAIVVAAHLFSKRDNPAGSLPVEPGGPGLH
jgi:hypothetical protein